jgi:hypothetical protein
MTRLLTRPVVAAAVLAVLVSACSDSAMSASDYASALEVGTDAYIAESQVLSGAFQRTVEDEIAQLAETGKGDLLSIATEITSRETVQYMSLLEDAMMRYGSSLETIEPPAALSDPHDAYVLALGSVRSSMQATRDAIGSAEDLDGIQIAITGSGFSDGQLRLRTACSSLEVAVRQEGHGIDLGCTRPTDVVGRP